MHYYRLDQTGNNPAPDRMLSSSAVMEQLGYRCPKAFWRLVRGQGIPYVRFNARVIKFPEAGLSDWIRTRRSAA